jgi:hypothetical protein
MRDFKRMELGAEGHAYTAYSCKPPFTPPASLLAYHSISWTTLDGSSIEDAEKEFFVDVLRRFSRIHFAEILGCCCMDQGPSNSASTSSPIHRSGNGASSLAIHKIVFYNVYI